MTTQNNNNLRIALVVPHIFMHRDILPQVIFSPGHLAIALADELTQQGHDVTLYTPGPVATSATNITADLSLFESELEGRGYGYIELLKKHPFLFVTLARQVQSEIITRAYQTAATDFDIVHVYANEEEMAYTFSDLCAKPVVFTHHDPYNFLIKYKANLPKYKDRNWISLSHAQRGGMPDDTNWAGNVYHGLDDPALFPLENPSADYVAYLGRIIHPKGVHLAIRAVQHYNRQAAQPLKLKIAGKHYADGTKDSYWQEQIVPLLDDPNIEYVGYIKDSVEKQQLLANAQCLMVPSLFDEPFGMVSIEAFACGTPVIALDSGALPEVVSSATGIIVQKTYGTDHRVDEETTMRELANAINRVASLDRTTIRQEFEKNFSLQAMAENHISVYRNAIRSQDQS